MLIKNPKISIITPCFNSEKTIRDTLKSIQSQKYLNIELIVIDGLSTDNTNKIIAEYSEIVVTHISEPDNGLYDAINKGIKLASGDIIGILNSDDTFSDELSIQKIAHAFTCLNKISGVFADLGVYDKSTLTIKKRHYSSKGFTKEKFSRGIMPAHPTFYTLKECYKEAGLYRTDFKIASDFDLILRIFSLPKTSFHYIEEEIVKMRIGGISSSGIKATYLLNKEIIISCRSNGIKTNWLAILSKYPKKLLEFIV